MIYATSALKRTLAFRPSLQIASQSARDCSEAQGLVSSICHHNSGQFFLRLRYVEHDQSRTHIVNTKVVESLGDLDLLFGIEESIGELLTLTQGTLDNLETGDIAQEIGDTDVVAVGVAGSGGVRVLAGLDTSEAGVVSCRNTRVSKPSGVYYISQDHIVPPLAPLAPLACPLGSESAPGHIVRR